MALVAGCRFGDKCAFTHAKGEGAQAREAAAAAADGEGATAVAGNAFATHASNCGCAAGAYTRPLFSST
jgi:hypothetical protein